MSKWSKSVLADITEITMGQSPDSALYNDNGSGYPFLQGCADFGKRFPAPKIYCSDPKKIGWRNSILISVRAPVGELNMADQDYCIGRGVSAIYPSNVNRDFLYNAMLLNKKLFYRVSQGSTFEAINSNDLNSFQIEYPDDIALQNKIARILTTVDQAIAQTEKAIEKLKKIKQGMMHDLFTRGIDVKTGKLRPPHSEAPELYKETELGLIPKDWEVGKLGDLILGNGIYGLNAPAVNYSPDLPTYLRITDISEEGYFIFDDKKSVNDLRSDQYYLEEGDIVFARTGNSTGKTYLYDPKDGRLVFAGFLIKFKTDKRYLLSKFLYFFTETYWYWNWVSSMSARTGQPGVNAEEYTSMKLFKPGINEQNSIQDKLNKIRINIFNFNRQLLKYKQIKQGLMQDLLTGKVEVTPDPQDKEYQEVS